MEQEQPLQQQYQPKVMNNTRPNIPVNRPVFQQPINNEIHRPAPKKLSNSVKVPIMGLLVGENKAQQRGKKISCIF